MIIASTNNYTDAASSFTVTGDADGDEDINDILTPDFSTAYTSAGSAGSFVFSRTFSSSFNARYVGIAGHNLSSIGGSLTLRINGVIIDTVATGSDDQNFPIVFFFDEVSVTTIEITMAKSNAADKATISYVAAGSLLTDAFTFPEQNQPEGGFPIDVRTRGSKIRATINDSAAPVAYVRESITRKVTLGLNNIAKSVLDSIQWLNFQDLVYKEDGVFFMLLEDGVDYASNTPRLGMLGFNVDVMPPKIHPQTRALVSLQIAYNVYTGA